MKQLLIVNIVVLAVSAFSVHAECIDKKLEKSAESKGVFGNLANKVSSLVPTPGCIIQEVEEGAKNLGGKIIETETRVVEGAKILGGKAKEAETEVVEGTMKVGGKLMEAGIWVRNGAGEILGGIINEFIGTVEKEAKELITNVGKGSKKPVRKETEVVEGANKLDGRFKEVEKEFMESATLFVADLTTFIQTFASNASAVVRHCSHTEEEPKININELFEKAGTQLKESITKFVSSVSTTFKRLQNGDEHTTQ